jgi:CRP-like cAMP-binding protein
MIDFGAAVVQDNLDELEDYGIFGARGRKVKVKSAASTGTTAYWPPERFKKGIIATPAMDMWSLGVVLYIMLTGVHPFDVQGISTDKEIEQRIRQDPRPPLHDSIVGHLSDSAIDLIVRLMEPDPKKRITAYQMLQHPWVRGETALTEKIPDSDTKLSRFKDLRYKLEAGMFAVMVSQSNKDAKLSEARAKSSKMSEREDASVHILQRAFQVFDAEGKGFVTADDLGRVTNERLGSHISSTDTKEFLATQSGGIESSSALSLSQFNKLFSGLRQKHFPRGHYIFHAGDKGEAMYFICSGKVEIQTRKGQLVSILRSGDFFGEGSLVETENVRFTTAKCATPVDVIEISRQELDRFVGASPNTKNELRAKWRARSLTYAKNLLRLQKNVQERVYKKGDVIYREGDIGSAMFRVHDVDGGELEVSHNGVVVHNYVGGDSFGESSLLFKRPRS